jgi:hypothetical protein
MWMQANGSFSSFAVGIGAVVCLYRFGARLDWFQGFLGWGIGALVFFFAAASVAFFHPKSRWFSMVVMLAGIPFGVAADATYDSFVNHRDRNLFPFEIILWWVCTVVPTIVVFNIGRLFRTSRGQTGEA